MAKTKKEPAEEVVLPEPATAETGGEKDNVWLRGLWTLILFILFGVAELIVIVAAILQFGWMLFAKEKNPQIAALGTTLGHWLAKTARFQTGQSEEKPFPWTKLD